MLFLVIAFVFVIWAQIKISMGLPVSDSLLSAPIAFVVLYLVGLEIRRLTQRSPDKGGHRL